jgi:hypothetical protein
MGKRIKCPRYLFVISIISFTIFLLTQCIDRKNEETAKPRSFADFAGSSSCAGCHKEIYDSHIHTAHYLSLQPASEKFIKGNFHQDSNSYSYNPDVEVKMEKRDSGFYQVVYYKNEEVKSLRFDFVVGSASKGQSYLYWQNNRLFQLPVSFFTAANQWSNSPGFPPGRIIIDRPITSRCMECHCTYVDTLPVATTTLAEFDKNKMLFGVDCEKCHGPAAEHVAYHTEHPGEKKGKEVINPASFTRQQSLDLCASCHGGRLEKIRPSFQFTAGDKLSDYFAADPTSSMAVAQGRIDVHGNQYGLLSASKCFTASNTLTCNSCHDTHKNERGNLAVFSQRCMNCHNAEHGNFCKMDQALIPGMKSNCIDCHMPAQPSMSIALFLPNAETPLASLVRSHFISVYPDEMKKFMEKNNNNK